VVHIEQNEKDDFLEGGLSTQEWGAATVRLREEGTIKKQLKTFVLKMAQAATRIWL